MSDEFFREVDEEYRRDQVSQIWKKYNTLIIGVIALIVVGVGGYRYWEGVQRSKAQQASADFMQAVSLIQAGKGAEAEQALAALGKDAPAGYALLSRFVAAAETAAKDKDAAVRDYATLASDSGLPSEWRDLARLRGAMLQLDGSDDAKAQGDLELLAVASGPWRHTAREMLGLLQMKRSDYAAAGRWFDAIAQDAETPPGLRSRLPAYAAVVAGGPVRTEK